MFNTKSKKLCTIKYLNTISNNYLDVFYFDILNPLIIIRVYKNKTLVEIKSIELKEVQLDSGVILNIEYIISKIAELIPDIKKSKYFMNLKISSTNIFKSSISLPKVSFLREFQLKQKELKDNFFKYDKYYKLIENKYRHNLGVVYNEYFLDNNMINNWLEISKSLNIKLASIQLFPAYLFETLQSFDTKEKEVLKTGDFAFIHIYNGSATFILSSSNELSNTYTFDFSSKEEIINKFILVIGKHEFSFEKKKINNIFVDSDIEIDLKEYLEDVNIYNVDLMLFKDVDISE